MGHDLKRVDRRKDLLHGQLEYEHEDEIRDEERKCRQEALAQNPGVNVSEIKRQEKVAFMTMNEFESVDEPPFYFKPELSSGRALPSQNIESPPANKRARIDGSGSPIGFPSSPPVSASVCSGQAGCVALDHFSLFRGKYS